MARDPDDPLLRYYMAELDYLMAEGAAFADRFPKAARSLASGAGGAPDPQVDRLIESFAFLTARLQMSLDSGWPEAPEGLLTQLYPHLVAPVPSMAIASLTADPDNPNALAGEIAPRGMSLLSKTGDVGIDYDRLTCRFRTVYPVALWPLTISDVALDEPARHALPPRVGRTETVLRLTLSCAGRLSFDAFPTPPAQLRFHLHADDHYMSTERRTVLQLYDLLFNNVVDVLVRRDGEADFIALPSNQIRLLPVGFAPDEGALPHPVEAHQGYRLLQEYFAFPDKFLFFDLVGLPPIRSGRSIEMLFLLDRRERLTLKPGMFRLGCTPIVNLFARTSEPIRLEPTRYEYRLNPDNRWERATEIHSILKISTTAAADDDRGVIEPFFAFTHAAASRGQRSRWLARRRPINRADMTGDEILLSFHDEEEFTRMTPSAPVLFAHTLCTNRDVAAQLPSGAGLEIEIALPIGPNGARCLTAPTPQLRPPLGGRTLWRLVSHLSLNHRSLVEGPRGIEAMREILRLYGHAADPSIDSQINALTAVSTRRIVDRVGQDVWRGFLRGTEITIDYDMDAFINANASPFLLGQVLSPFFGLYAAINSFTQLVMRPQQSRGREVSFEAQANGAPLRSWRVQPGGMVSI